MLVWKMYLYTLIMPNFQQQKYHSVGKLEQF